MAEVQAEGFRTEVIEPHLASKTGAEISAIAIEFSERLMPLNEPSLLAIYHAHQAHAVTGILIGGFEQAYAPGASARSTSRRGGPLFTGRRPHTSLGDPNNERNQRAPRGCRGDRCGDAGRAPAPGGEVDIHDLADLCFV